MGIDVAEIVGPILAHFNAKFDTLQKNIDSRFDQLDMRWVSMEIYGFFAVYPTLIFHLESNQSSDNNRTGNEGFHMNVKNLCFQ